MKDADIVVSEVIKKEKNGIERTDGRDYFQSPHNLSRISFAAACTKKAVDYMKRYTSQIIVLGFENGKVGKDCSAGDFGKTGIARGYRDYRWSCWFGSVRCPHKLPWYSAW